MRSLIHSAWKNTSEFLLPPLTESKFKERGVLTPEEFVKAGDFLVRTCPTWTWEAGDASKRWSFLPKEKQYLTTKNVPCHKRASAVETYFNEEDSGAGESGVTEDGFENLPSSRQRLGDIYEIKDDECEGRNCEAEILDISDLNLDSLAEDDDAAAPVQKEDNSSTGDETVVRTRKYTIVISYDKHYQVPRVWLIGYGEDGNLLDHNEVMEDVISDYYSHRDRKTVTVENHPHREVSGTVVSIHPCRHGAVMKKLAGVVASNQQNDFDVEQYMVLFLKFISSVVPTIEYDYTMASGI